MSTPMQSLAERTAQLGDKEYRLKVSTASSRIAQMKHGRDVDMRDVQKDPMAFSATLVWLSMLPYQPDVTEEEAVLLLARSDNEGEIVGWALERYLEAIEELGKRLSPKPAAQPKKAG